MPDGKSHSEITNHHDLESLVLQCQLYLPGIVRQVCQRFHRYPSPEKIEDDIGKILLLLLENDYYYLRTFDPTKASLKTWLNTVTENKLKYEFKHKKSWESLDETLDMLRHLESMS